MRSIHNIFIFDLCVCVWKNKWIASNSNWTDTENIPTQIQLKIRREKTNNAITNNISVVCQIATYTRARATNRQTDKICGWLMNDETPATNKSRVQEETSNQAQAAFGLMLRNRSSMIQFECFVIFGFVIYFTFFYGKVLLTCERFAQIPSHQVGVEIKLDFTINLS